MEERAKRLFRPESGGSVWKTGGLALKFELRP